MPANIQKDGFIIYTSQEFEKISIETELLRTWFCCVSHIALCQGKRVEWKGDHLDHPVYSAIRRVV